MHRNSKFLSSIFTLTTFVFTQFNVVPDSYAAANLPFSEVPVASAGHFTLPSELGTIESLNLRQGPMIVHIQTAHGNFEAQKNIQGILEFLKKNHGFNTLLLEGSAYPLNPEIIRFFPEDMKLTHAIAEDLTRKAIFKGADLFMIDNPGVTALGIENVGLYRENGTAFRAVLRQEEAAGNFVRDMNMQIERLTSPYLNKDLRSFLNRLDAYESKQVPLQDWLNTLKAEASKQLAVDLSDPIQQVEWPMLVRLFTLTNFEAKLDRNALAKEKTAFLKAINRVPKNIYTQVESLLTQPVSRNQLPDPETELLFEKLVENLPKNFNYKAYPNVSLFIGHLILQSEIKGMQLMEEVSSLQDKISERMALTQEEKQILGLLKDHRLLKKLFALQLTPGDYESVLARTNEMKPAQVIARFESLNGSKRVKDVKFSNIENINELYAKALEFYRLVKERDLAMINNVPARMKEAGVDKAVVITGGFHAEPFRKFANAEGYQYALIAPKMTTTEGHEAYVQTVLQTGSVILSEAKNLRRGSFDRPSDSFRMTASEKAPKSTLETVFVGVDSPELLEKQGINPKRVLDIFFSSTKKLNVTQKRSAATPFAQVLGGDLIGAGAAAGLGGRPVVIAPGVTATMGTLPSRALAASEVRVNAPYVDLAKVAGFEKEKQIIESAQQVMREKNGPGFSLHFSGLFDSKTLYQYEKDTLELVQNTAKWSRLAKQIQESGKDIKGILFFYEYDDDQFYFEVQRPDLKWIRGGFQPSIDESSGLIIVNMDTHYNGNSINDIYKHLMNVDQLKRADRSEARSTRPEGPPRSGLRAPYLSKSPEVTRRRSEVRVGFSEEQNKTLERVFKAWGLDDESAATHAQKTKNHSDRIYVEQMTLQHIAQKIETQLSLNAPNAALRVRKEKGLLDQVSEDGNAVVTALLDNEELRKYGVFQRKDLDVDPKAAARYRALAAKTSLIWNTLDGGIGESLMRMEWLLNKGLRTRLSPILLALPNEVDEKYSESLMALKIAEEAGDTAKIIEALRKIEKLAGYEPLQVIMGAKGTDLGRNEIIRGDEYFVGDAEARLLFMADLAAGRSFGKIAFQPLVNYQSLGSYHRLLTQPYLFDVIENKTNPRTYEQALQDAGVEILELLEQKDLPKFEVDADKTQGFPTEDSRPRTDGKAKGQPGGHGQWGVYFTIDFTENAPEQDGLHHVRFFGNGDNRKGNPEPLLVGFAIENKLPIIKITTPATAIDRKGGKEVLRIAHVQDRVVGILDQWEEVDAKNADAAVPGQSQLFYEAGQRDGFGAEGKQLFNTNLFLFNIDLLNPILNEIRNTIGPDAFLDAIIPRLFDKSDKAVTIDGKKYVSLDSAIGYVIHRLNTFYVTDSRLGAVRQTYGPQLLYYMNYDRDIFAPKKKAEDQYLQQGTDYYSGFDEAIKNFHDSETGLTPPGFDITDPVADKSGKLGDSKFWNEAQHWLDSFGLSKVRRMRSLKVEGRVTIRNAEYVGEVVIINRFERTDSVKPAARVVLSSGPYRDQLKQLGFIPGDHILLENIRIEIDVNGVLTAKPIVPVPELEAEAARLVRELKQESRGLFPKANEVAADLAAKKFIKALEGVKALQARTKEATEAQGLTVPAEFTGKITRAISVIEEIIARAEVRIAKSEGQELAAPGISFAAATVVREFLAGILPLSYFYALLRSGVSTVSAVVSEILGRSVIASEIQEGEEAVDAQLRTASIVIADPVREDFINASDLKTAKDATAETSGRVFLQYDVLKSMEKNPQALRLLLEGFKDAQAESGSQNSVLAVVLPQGLLKENIEKLLLQTLGRKDSGVAGALEKEELLAAIELITLKAGETEAKIVNDATAKYEGAVSYLGDREIAGLDTPAVFAFDLAQLTRRPSFFAGAALVTISLNRLNRQLRGVNPELRGEKLDEFVAKSLDGAVEKRGNVFMLNLTLIIQTFMTKRYIETQA